MEQKGIVRPIGKLRANVDALEYFSLPAARVIGKSIRSPMGASAPNPIPSFWDEFLADGCKKAVYALPRLAPGLLGFMDDFDAAGGTFRYTIGVLCPAGTPVPESYVCRELSAATVSKGKYGEWMDECRPAWTRDGYRPASDWCAELYLDGEPTAGFRLLQAVAEA